MKSYSLINSGLESVALIEANELTKVLDEKPSVILIEGTPQKIIDYAFHVQCARRVLIGLGSSKNPESLTFDSGKEFFQKSLKITIKVEGVKGQENRQKIARTLGKKLQEFVGDDLTFDYKNPDITLIVFFNGKEYFVGIDVMGQELDQRHFRVFPHSASFKGDYAYYFLRKTGFKKGQNFIMDFCKDGAIPIEAALFSGNLPIQDVEETYAYSKLQGFENCKPPKEKSTGALTVYAVDESRQNTDAARKNAGIAGANVKVQKNQLDELDVKFEEKSTDLLMFQVTSKDEGRMNEIYYQASYVLKKGGHLAFISRQNWDLSISSKFKLLEKEDIVKGDSIHRLWVLELK